MHDGQSVNNHCLTMIKDIKKFQKLRMNMDKELQVNLILQSLLDLYGQFIMNYHMNKIDSTLPELLNMLVIAEGTLKSSKDIVLTVEWIFFKRKSSFKKKKKPVKKQKNEVKPKKQILKKLMIKNNIFIVMSKATGE